MRTGMTKRIIISIIDDDEVVRDSISSLLAVASYAPQSYASAKQFLESFNQATACVIVDVHMPEMGGLELQEELIRLCTGLPIIFVTGQGNVALAVQALQAGAVDFIEKPFTTETLLNSIMRAVKIGQQSIGDSAEVRGAEAMLGLLTPRERGVMKLLVDGCSTKMAAFELGISPRTVELHRARILAKTCARNLGAVVRVAMTAAKRPCALRPSPAQGLSVTENARPSTDAYGLIVFREVTPHHVGVPAELW
jgi:FixJ family two-component response regulator